MSHSTAVSALAAFAILVSAAGAPAQNVIPNPDFTTGVEGWSPFGPVLGSGWSATEGDPDPGALEMVHPGACGCPAWWVACVPVSPSTGYEFSYRLKRPTGLASGLFLSTIVEWFSGEGCGGSVTPAFQFGPELSSIPADVWGLQEFGPEISPPSAASARIRLGIDHPNAGAVTLYFDSVALAPPVAPDCPPGSLPDRHLEQSWEGGPGAWVSTGEGDTWTQSSSRVHAGDFAWHATDPETVSDQQLISPPVALPAGENPVLLTFWSYQELERQGELLCWDAGIAEISTDGVTWTPVASSQLLGDPYDGAVAVSQNPLEGLEAWCGDPHPWTRAVIDLSAWAGQTVQLRFRLGSDESVGREGWYVDEIAVASCSTALLFESSFESGDLETSGWSAVSP